MSNNVMSKHEELIGGKASYWDLEAVVSNSFNRLKAKVYNLIEASVIVKAQQDAMKGLIRGFANDEFRNCLGDLRYYARLAKFLAEGEDSASTLPPLGAEPLETAAR